MIGEGYASTVKSGACGAKLTWKLSSGGKLTISGEGAMYAYGANTSAPWSNYGSEIIKVVIENGVTAIGNYAFYDLYSLLCIEVAAGNAFYSSQDGILFNKD